MLLLIIIASLALAVGATVFTHAGKAITTNLVTVLGGTAPKYVGWGTGAGTAAVGDTTLFTESADETRATGTITRVTTSQANDTVQVVGTMTCAVSGKTITNVGLFGRPAGGESLYEVGLHRPSAARRRLYPSSLKVQYT